jgi:ribosomal protein S18 acetylase RimI-like enzyme
VLVATDGDEPIGFLVRSAWLPLGSAAHVARVRGLAVDPERQGEGIGGRLIEAAIGRSREAGIRKLTLRVLSTNPGARRLYERHGFVVEGTIRDAFLLEGAYVDDLLMALDLGGR